MPRRAFVESQFLRTLTGLRWIAVGGQSLAVYAVADVLEVPLPLPPIGLAIAALAAFNLYVGLRPPAGPVPVTVALLHLGVDIAELALVIALSGGAMNPFVSLLLVPIALATLALPVAAIILVGALATLGYAAAAWLGPPLPHVHGLAGLFDLHMAGMAVNFLLTALILMAALTRLAALRENRERELARLREAAARAEGILGLGIHAAAMAHSLNTPLATLSLLLDDLAEDLRAQPALHADAERARQLVAVLSGQVRQLVREADPAVQRSEPLATWIEGLVSRWQLLRPEIVLARQIALPQWPVRADPALAHLLQALLDNAADASRARDRNRVRLALAVDGEDLIGRIEDEGGDALSAPTSAPLRSTKQGGWGMGLMLSHATVERLGGELELLPGDTGASARLRLPLASLRQGDSGS